VVRVVTFAASMESGHGFSSGNIFVLPLESWIRIPDGASVPVSSLEPESKHAVSPL